MIYILFFLSGFPALLYQIVWQRALFSIYGVNMESVTLVVSAFMLGLGLGSLAGGYLSKRPGIPVLATFSFLELGIGAFGIVSLRLFHFVATFTAGAPPLETGIVTFLLVLVPTTLMGATLPLLVAHLVHIMRNVGRSVGVLYFVNTLGSALACFLAAIFLMRVLGQSGSVTLAAVLNAIVGTTALVYHFLNPQRTTYDRGESADSTGSMDRTQQLLSLPAAVVLSGIAGFTALSYEIIWYRVYAFASENRAYAFALLLGAYLTGIALGSFYCKSLCQKTSTNYLRSIALLIIIANGAAFLVSPGTAFIVRAVSYPFALPLVVLSAALLGAAFPLLCHVSVPPDHKAGARLSYMYLGNILGSTLGSAVTGFVLMDVLTLRQVSVVVAMLGLASGLGLLLLTQKGSLRPAATPILAGIALLAAVPMSSHLLFRNLYEQLQFRKNYDPANTFEHVIETRSGVVTTTRDRTVYGNGFFDGNYSTDLMATDRQSNYIHRAYAISGYHPNPENILMIGMGSGSWANVIVNNPLVKKLTIIEINPGYVSMMRYYPQVSNVLTNPKMKLVIDDGRRWLVRNKDDKFDLILMNTTIHWRAHATNVLSAEFLRLVRSHLKPGGVALCQTTGSPEVQLTGTTVFPYSMLFTSCQLLSDSPIVFDRSRWRHTILEYRIDGKPVLDLSRPDHQQRLERVLTTIDRYGKDPLNGVETAESVRQRTKDRRIVTDDNMGTEWVLPWHYKVAAYIRSFLPRATTRSYSAASIP